MRVRGAWRLRVLSWLPCPRCTPRYATKHGELCPTCAKAERVLFRWRRGEGVLVDRRERGAT